MQYNKAITCVGSRETPKLITTLMELIGFKLASEGWEIRSGGAPGADSAFYRGVRSYCDKAQGPTTHIGRIYIPWEGFEGDLGKQYSNDVSGHFFCFKDFPLHVQNQAMELASTVHPYWDNCKYGDRILHARNVFQVLSEHFNRPSKALICWAPILGDSITGGTRTAWELAKREGIRLINLNRREDFEWALRYLGITEDRLVALAGG